MVSLSSRRSSLVPTRMMGVLGQWCRTSGYHWSTETLGLRLHCAIHAVLSNTSDEVHLPLHGRSQRTPDSPTRSRLKTRPVEETGKVLVLDLQAQFSYSPILVSYSFWWDGSRNRARRTFSQHMHFIVFLLLITICKRIRGKTDRDMIPENVLFCEKSDIFKLCSFYLFIYSSCHTGAHTHTHTHTHTYTHMYTHSHTRTHVHALTHTHTHTHTHAPVCIFWKSHITYIWNSSLLFNTLF